MVNNKFTLATFVSLLTAPSCWGETVYSQGHSTEILGVTHGAEVRTATTPVNQVTNQLQITSLGTTLEALLALTNPPNTIGGTTYTEVYSFNKRIFGGFVHTNGAQLMVGIAPTQIRVPFVVYPIGPVNLRIDGGARFQANLALNNMTNISIPIEFSEPGFQMQGVAAAAGFIEAYASMYVVRAGAGGQLDLVDAKLDVNSRFSLEGAKPSVQVSAIAEFLKGRIYAFFDFFGLFAWGWKRLIDYDLYNWQGACYATGNLQCPAKST